MVGRDVGGGRSGLGDRKTSALSSGPVAMAMASYGGMEKQTTPIGRAVGADGVAMHTGLDNFFASQSEDWYLDPNNPHNAKIKGYARGGVIPAGEVAIVGEEGPEAIVARQPVQVIPNNKLITSPYGQASMTPRSNDNRMPIQVMMDEPGNTDVIYADAEAPAVMSPVSRPGMNPALAKLQPKKKSALTPRDVDLRRYARSPQGVRDFVASGQDMANQDARVSAMMDMAERERAWQNEDKATEAKRKKSEKDAQDAEDSAAVDFVADAMGQSLTARQRQMVKQAKGADAKKTLIDVFAKENAANKEAESEGFSGIGVMTSPDGAFAVPYYESSTGKKKPAGGAFPIQKGKSKPTIPDGFEPESVVVDGARYSRPQQPKAKAPVIQELDVDGLGKRPYQVMEDGTLKPVRVQGAAPTATSQPAAKKPSSFLLKSKQLGGP